MSIWSSVLSRRIGLPVLLALAVALAAASAAGVARGGHVRATAGELAPDPDFESDPSSSYYTYGSATYTWATDAAHSPSHSLKIVSTQPSGTMTRWMTRTAAIAATAGTVYTASVYLKTTSAGSANLSADFWDGSFNYLGVTTDSQKLSGTNDWTLVSLKVTAPAKSAYIRLEFRLFGSGTLWADDVSLTTGGGGGGSGLPLISGSARQGQFLTTTLGSPAPSSPFIYWYRCDQAGANCAQVPYPTTQDGTGSDQLRMDHDTTYLLTADDVGYTIRSEVVGGGGVATRSAPTAVVTATQGLPQNTAQPVISGPGSPLHTLTASSGSWTGSPTTYSYQWFQCVYDVNVCDELPGETGAALHLDLESSSGFYRVLVFATNAAGTTRENNQGRFSYHADLAVYSLPTISGAPTVGSKLTASWRWTINDDPAAATQWTVSWLRCNSHGESCVTAATGGANDPSYVVTSADVGSTIRVLVTGELDISKYQTTSGGPVDLTIASAPTAVVSG